MGWFVTSPEFISGDGGKIKKLEDLSEKFASIKVNDWLKIKGIGEKLLKHLLILAQTERILVGTWETSPWAVKFYENYGFKLLSREEKNRLLKTYWNISERQVATSIVLEYNRNLQ